MTDSFTRSFVLFSVVMILLSSIILIPCYTQDRQYQEDRKKTKHPQLQTDKKVINYDTIIENSNTTSRIILTNEGDTTLQVYNVRSSCGVSVPAWPRQPIEPGEEAFIQMKYNSSRLGPINRKLIIHSNSPENTRIIKIEGYVVPKEAM